MIFQYWPTNIGYRYANTIATGTHDFRCNLTSSKATTATTARCSFWDGLLWEASWPFWTVLGWSNLGGGNSNVFFMFTPIWGIFPIWLTFFKRVETTNEFWDDQILKLQSFQWRSLRSRHRWHFLVVVWGAVNLSLDLIVEVVHLIVVHLCRCQTLNFGSWRWGTSNSWTMSWWKQRRKPRGFQKITLLRVIPTMTCWVKVVRWGLSGWIGSVIFPTRDKEPWRNPSHLFSGLLRALVVSCPPFSIAPGTNHAKSCQRRRRNMPNHVRTPPGKHISINRHQTWQYTSWSKVNIRCSNHKCLQCTIRSILCTKQAKSCQDTACQTNINNQASNMAAYPLKQSQKL